MTHFPVLPNKPQKCLIPNAQCLQAESKKQKAIEAHECHGFYGVPPPERKLHCCEFVLAEALIERRVGAEGGVGLSLLAIPRAFHFGQRQAAQSLTHRNQSPESTKKLVTTPKCLMLNSKQKAES